MEESYKARSIYLRRLTFAAVVVSTFTVTACLALFPTSLHYLQSLQTEVALETSFCKMSSRDLWKEIVDIESNKEDIDPTHVARVFGNLRSVDPSARVSHVVSKRQSDGMECCTCHRGAAGAAGAPGADGRDGPDGLDGTPGEIGRPAPDADSGIQFPPQCPCDAPQGTKGPGGPKGPPGTSGHPGQDGVPGTNGQPGKGGSKGPKGPPGRGGSPGQRGGPGGLKDAGGPKGQPGNPGTPGNPGRAGTPGKDGQNGNKGPQGQPGQPGRRGNDGFPGSRGKPGQSGDGGPVGSCAHCTAARLAPGY